jgi:UDP-N-acetyl-D-glucosamine dehydrogenase
VIGQGYVGVTLACAAAEAGFVVHGIDIDQTRVADLSRGFLSVPGVKENAFQSATATGRTSFSWDPAVLGESDIIVICVPTPVEDQAPDLSHVRRACEDTARYLKVGQLVILESTTYPGTTDDFVRPLLELSGLRLGRDFLLGYSPERIDPGNEEFDLQNTPRVVGGATPEATGLISLFYEQIVDKVVVVSSCRAAETAKLLENTFRHVNIALVNEMAILCREMDIDIWEVVDAAATKPFGFMPFIPGPGVGGHCIPLDPTYLAWQVRRQAGHQFRILEQAEDINAQMPSYVAGRIGDVLNEAGKAVKGARILVLGVTYKANVGDTRESPALKVMAQLHRRGAQLSFHDPFLPPVSMSEAYGRQTEITLRAVASADCVALLTPHATYDLEWIAQKAKLVFDARNAYNGHCPANVVRL